MSRLTRGQQFALRVRGYHPLRHSFPRASTCLTVATGLVRVRSPLLAESRLMSFPPGTEMFQFPGFAFNPYVFRAKYLHLTIRSPKPESCSQDQIPCGPILEYELSKVGFPIRKSADQSLFSAPRGLSQRITSFIACACQGIHRTPLFHLFVLIANAHR